MPHSSRRSSSCSAGGSNIEHRATTILNSPLSRFRRASTPSPALQTSLTDRPPASPSVGTGGSIDSSGYGAYTSGGTAQPVEARWENLDHLVGETVAICGTDVNDLTTKYTTEVVSASGVVDIGTDSADNLVRRAIVGLPYTYKLRPMRLVWNVDGTTSGSQIRISEIVANFYNTLNAKYGKSLDDLKDITWTTTAYTGDKVLEFDGGYDEQSNLYISGSDPLPCTVRAIIVRIYKSGR